jgi:hypothetical protein
MYRINDNLYAIEETDNITFIRDDGGKLDICIGEQKTLNSEEGPRIIEKEEAVILCITKEIPF